MKQIFDLVSIYADKSYSGAWQVASMTHAIYLLDLGVNAAGSATGFPVTRHRSDSYEG